jgi:23S rRNA (uracil1939-C5)-methyltransferase
VNRALERLRSMMREPRFPSFIRQIEVFTNEADVQVNVLESTQRVARWFFEWAGSSDRIEYSAAGETFRVGARSFFQVNRFLVDRLVKEAIAGADGGSAFDLYAGVGLFAVPLARRASSVVAVENNPAAAGDLRANCRLSGTAARAVTSTADAFLSAAGACPDFVLADPPRSGLGKQVTALLAQLRAPRVTIVSCDPSTLARDLAALAGAGYGIQGVTLIDLFPHTYHIESIVRLRLR